MCISSLEKHRYQGERQETAKVSGPDRLGDAKKAVSSLSVRRGVTLLISLSVPEIWFGK